MPLCLRFTMHKMGKSQHVTYFTCYMRLNEIMNVQCLAYYLGHSKGSVNVSPCHNDLHHSHCGCRDHHHSSASPPLSSHQQQHCHYCCCHCCPLHREHHPCPLHNHSAPPPSSPVSMGAATDSFWELLEHLVLDTMILISRFFSPPFGKSGALAID